VVSSSVFHLVEFSVSSSLVISCVVVSHGVSVEADDGDDGGDGGDGDGVDGGVVVRME